MKTHERIEHVKSELKKCSSYEELGNAWKNNKEHLDIIKEEMEGSYNFLKAHAAWLKKSLEDTCNSDSSVS